ncbi:hypothetical protein BD809_10143 [Aquimarina intermedia]|uniref:Uncharacterized protein n=1 Tax=Aquimarina intermedia TaxID=350814 RepID=A0A5S5CE18_9FLAO|nr:hypothetical protein BD809_10143 [Aquimarina intermedia]
MNYIITANVYFTFFCNNILTFNNSDQIGVV